MKIIVQVDEGDSYDRYIAWSVQASKFTGRTPTKVAREVSHNCSGSNHDGSNIYETHGVMKNYNSVLTDANNRSIQHFNCRRSSKRKTGKPTLDTI